MDVDQQEMVISGDSGQIALAIYPEPGAKPDEAGFIWLRCSFACKVGPFNAQFPLQMTGHDVQSLYDSLVALSVGTASRTCIGNLEEDFSFTLTSTKTGSVIVEGRINPRVADYATLQFTFSSDLQTMASSADTLRHLYPVKPSGV